MVACMLGGCIIPAEIQAPEDSAPRILLGLTSPSPLVVQTIRQRATPDRPVVTPFNVAVVDPDPQTLRARLFIDARYGQPPVGDLGDDAIGPDPGNPDGARGYVFSIRDLCDEKVDFELGAHTLELYVSDEGFVDSGPDWRVPRAGGQRDSVLWRLSCIAPLGEFEP